MSTNPHPHDTGGQTAITSDGASDPQIDSLGTPSASVSHNVRILGWTSLCNDVASEAIYPVVPVFLTEVLGGNKVTLGLIQGISESISSLLKLASGALSDRWQTRKRWLVVGYLVSVVSRPVLAVVSSPGQLFAARVVDRMGKGLRTAPRDALISESTPPGATARAFGYHRAMDHAGAALGPLGAAAYLAVWPHELRMLFLLTLLPGLVVVGLLVFGLREIRRPPERAEGEPPADAAAASGFRRGFGRYLVAVSLFSLGNASDAFLLIRLREMGMRVEWLPLFWFGLHLLKSLANRGGGWLADRWGAYRSLRIGWTLYALAFFGFGWAQQIWQFLLPSLLYAAYFGLVEPAEKTYVVNLVGGRRGGVGFGWYHFVTGVAVFPASLLFGWLYETRGAMAAYAVAALMALAAVAMLPKVQTERGGGKAERI